MAIREFELFHGAILTRLVRSNKPITLRMIETRPVDAWSTYRLNDEVNVLFKHSLAFRKTQRDDARVWNFAFTRDQISQLRTQGTWAALVCGCKACWGNMDGDMSS